MRLGPVEAALAASVSVLGWTGKLFTLAKGTVETATAGNSVGLIIIGADLAVSVSVLGWVGALTTDTSSLFAMLTGPAVFGAKVGDPNPLMPGILVNGFTSIIAAPSGPLDDVSASTDIAPAESPCDAIIPGRCPSVAAGAAC